jgi:hypothetical protein
MSNVVGKTSEHDVSVALGLQRERPLTLVVQPGAISIVDRRTLRKEVVDLDFSALGEDSADVLGRTPDVHGSPVGVTCAHGYDEGNMGSVVKSCIILRRGGGSVIEDHELSDALLAPLKRSLA